MNFNEAYTKYWSSAVNKSVDGTIIAGINEAKYFLQYLGIERGDRILDLGCSFGRMYDALATYSDWVFGVEPDMYAIEKAQMQPYKEIRQGYAEQTGFDKSFFDFVFCWAVFDVVDHKGGLLEINRILKTGGKLLISGKSSTYFSDDVLAFKAEKNAYLKGFPGKFTNLNQLLSGLHLLGLRLEKIFIFPRRGDFGKLNFLDQTNMPKDYFIGYEYLILCEKVIDVIEGVEIPFNFEEVFSETAIQLALRAGFSDAKDYFSSIGID